MSEDEKRNLRRRGSKRTSPVLSVDTATATTSRPAKKAKQAHKQSFRWMDEGTISPDGTIDHTTLEVCSSGSCYQVCLGDAVKLLSDDISLSPQNMMVASSEDTTFIGRIERMWEVSSKKKRINSSDRMTIRWYFKVRIVRKLECVEPSTIPPLTPFFSSETRH
jgi:hypothetical protein